MSKLPPFPTMLRKMWSGGEVQQWMDDYAGPVVAAMQARIDALMLEYCPNEMTQEQFDNWAAHQQAVEFPPELLSRIARIKERVDENEARYTLTESGRKHLAGEK